MISTGYFLKKANDFNGLKNPMISTT